MKACSISTNGTADALLRNLSVTPAQIAFMISQTFRQKFAPTTDALCGILWF